MDSIQFAEPACNEKDFFGRLRIPGHHPMAYDAIFEPKDSWWTPSNGITFTNTNLNLAVACLRQYITFCGSLEWYHLEVSEVAFESFYRAMEADHGLTVLLPFWNWCDHGNEEHDRHRHHRHMIAVAASGHFIPHVWKKIQVSEADIPNGSFQAIRKSRIGSFINLVAVISFLSERKSICSDEQSKELNNFFINRPLSKLAMWPLVSQFKNGLESLINEELFNCPMTELLNLAKWKNNIYKIAIKDLPNMPLHYVFPVSKHYKPTKHNSPFFIYALGNRKIYFEKEEQISSLPNDKWAQLQAKGGNVFHRMIGNIEVCPTKKQQHYLNIIIPLMKRNKDLEEEVQILKNKMSRKKRKNVTSTADV